jgi:hypothetical protein
MSAVRPARRPPLPRWGFVTAEPAEYLVHVRRGQIRERSSGQGASAFVLPWDSLALVPTALQKLSFRADQVTAEKVGVEVVGLAVYRIAEPLLAYRVLDGAAPERLAETLTAMFVGATRRLVANLSLEACLAERKSALAVELVREIAPVVSGRGRADDTTSQGWGVVIDTIEIQEVRILSERVFAALQAPYRAAVDRAARAAKIEAESQVATREAEVARAVAEQRLSDEAALGEQRRIRALEDAESATRATLERTRLAQLEADALIQSAELASRRFEVDASRARAEAALAIQLRQLEAEAARAIAEGELALEARRAEIDVVRAGADARRTVADRLPALAQAMGQRIQEVRIHRGASEGQDALLGLAQTARAALELLREP